MSETRLNIELEAFTGPFDLLLKLIEKKKIDIYDIELEEITNSYLEEINKLNDDIENLGYELVDIEFIGPKNEKRLIFYIYNESGINIDDCEKVSTFLDEKLDQLDLISTSYYLEVSSQDLSRPLKLSLIHI